MLSPGNFKVPLALTVKKKRIVRFEGLPEFKWSDLGEQDVVGHDSFGAVFLTKYAKDLDRNSGESVVVKNCLVSLYNISMHSLKKLVYCMISITVI